MTTDRPADDLRSLVRELCKLPRETEQVEFKLNKAEPKTLGEYISALVNAFALPDKALACVENRPAGWYRPSAGAEGRRGISTPMAATG